MRTREQIDAEYAGVAAQYGDRLFKVTMLQEEVKSLFQKMAELSQEPAGPLPTIFQQSTSDAPPVHDKKCDDSAVNKVSQMMLKKPKKKEGDDPVA